MKCTTEGYLYLSQLSLNADGTWLHHNIVLQKNLILLQNWINTFLSSIVSSYTNQEGEPHSALSLPSSLPLLGTWDLEILFSLRDCWVYNQITQELEGMAQCWNWSGTEVRPQNMIVLLVGNVSCMSLNWLFFVMRKNNKSFELEYL